MTNEQNEPQPAEEPMASQPEPASAQKPAQEADALKDRLLRLQADFDNFRKRVQRERAELYVKANEDILKDLTSVIDHFEMGLATATARKADKAVHDGFQLVYDQLLALGKKYGLAPLDAHSAAFDPHLHEAVSHVPSDEYAADEIVAQTRRGYKLGDRLIRPVQVVVSSGPGAPRDDEVKSDAVSDEEAKS